MMEIINIITRCSRINNLIEISKSIFSTDKFKINWFILFDTNRINNIDIDILSELYSLECILKFYKGENGDFGHNMINIILEEIKDGYVYILDDDNLLHENFYNSIYNSMKNNNSSGYIFNQKVDGKDFSGVDIRYAKFENVEIGKIDMGQFLLKRNLIGDIKFIKNTYVADGIFIKEIFNLNKNKFIFIDEVLSYYNYFKINNNSSPKILIIGTDNKDIKLYSKQLVNYESKDLNCLFIDDDNDINSVLNNFNPDTILTIGVQTKYNNLNNLSYDIRKRWLHTDIIKDDIGGELYTCASDYILGNIYDDGNPLISFFTPIYNTGDILWRTYESLRNQTYVNWEWVILNDSYEAYTLKIAENIANLDCRVKVYDFKVKSGGIIGDVKYKAASLCRGKYLAELDHDDYLTNDAAYYIQEAFKKYPDCKFVYSDCAEINENLESLTYGDGFAFGYGTYKDETYEGRTYRCINSVNINPKTIRHIVGVPNHIRVWDRLFYHSIGGHNRRLTIADDYELIVRTFLKTKMVRIPKLLYLQFYHNSNTQNNTRADIQRRVRTIREYYNYRIYKRFTELGVIDWAYNFNKNEPLLSDSKFGKDENYVNYIMVI